MKAKHVFSIIGGGLFLSLPVKGAVEDSSSNPSTAALLWTILPIVVVALPTFWYYWRVTKAKQARAEQRMERIEQTLDRVARALEKKDIKDR